MSPETNPALYSIPEAGLAVGKRVFDKVTHPIAAKARPTRKSNKTNIGR